jgi:hypothetical protein
MVSAHAAPPQPVIIQTNIVFVEGATDTFTASAPLCTSGTVLGLRVLTNPSAAHGWTVTSEYTCDDNSGTFVIQYHPQAGANYAGGTRDPDFTVAGPWSVVKGGTGRYATLTGHGDFGVVIDFEQTPMTGVETFVGFIQLD